MKRHLFPLVVLSLLILGIGYPIQAHTEAHNDNSFMYEYYDDKTDTWTNLTVTDDQYKVSSDLQLIDTIAGEFKHWSVINSLAKTMEEQNSESTICSERTNNSDRIYIHNTQLSVKWCLDSVDDLNSDQLMTYQQVHNQFKLLTGLEWDTALWPTSISMSVLESYPPQYKVHVGIQRGNDHLAVVKDVNVSLYAGLTDNLGELDDLSWLKSPYHSAESQISIASGNSSVVETLGLFSFGSAEDKLNYSKLAIYLLFDNGLGLHYHPQVDSLSVSMGDNMPNIGTVSDSENTKGGELTTSYFISVSIVLLVISARWSRDELI